MCRDFVEKISFVDNSSFFAHSQMVQILLYITNNPIKRQLWIELLRPENPANTWARHTETLDSSFDLIRSHQHCMQWSSPLEIEPATTECRAEKLPMSHLSISHTSDTKSTSHGNIVAN